MGNKILLTLLKYFISDVFLTFLTFITRNIVHSSHRKEGYDNQWMYYPGYDASFDDEYRGGEMCGDEFDRRSIHSEQSAHSVHSSRSHHSRRSSFSSRSQQVNVQIFLVCIGGIIWLICTCIQYTLSQGLS